ncbi:hypothetical protein Btru_000839 [Bulinus truncatus]|nr:hypothetical protein Btru_000839 [Bulinus truncatus]
MIRKWRTLVGILQLYVCLIGSDHIFLNQFAIQLKDGDKKTAENIAQEYGFIVKSRIECINAFILEHSNVPERSKRSADSQIDILKRDTRIQHVHQEVILHRVKRQIPTRTPGPTTQGALTSNTNKSRPIVSFSDPKFKDMWYLSKIDCNVTVLLEESADTPMSLLEESADTTMSLLEDSADTTMSLLDESADTPMSLLEESADTPMSLLEDSADTTMSLLDESADTPMSLLEDSADTPMSLLEESADTPMSLLEESADTPMSLLEDSADTTMSLLDESADTPMQC